jgi:Na+-transporting NADH:ubiquinone oxidoreductase subunit A
LCARPFGKVPPVEATPHAIFVTATDTQPLAARPEVIIAERPRDFERGLRLVAKLCPGTTYLCVAADSPLPGLVDAPVAVESFAGPHPAGSAGVHVHLLAPVDRRRRAWTIGYQDVLAIGRLFADGRLPAERVVSLAGPAVRRPRLLRTRLGAALDDLTAGELAAGDLRVLSGSVLSGKKAMGPVFGFLGRGDLQVSVLQEGPRPGPAPFSLLPRPGALLGRHRGAANTTAAHGGRRAVVPIGAYERVLPMDLLPTLLLRALLAGDDEQAERLGCLELLEEDLALCSFVCAGKNEYGLALRAALRRLEAEG